MCAHTIHNLQATLAWDLKCALKTASTQIHTMWVQNGHQQNLMVSLITTSQLGFKSQQWHLLCIALHRHADLPVPLNPCPSLTIHTAVAHSLAATAQTGGQCCLAEATQVCAVPVAAARQHPPRNGLQSIHLPPASHLGGIWTYVTPFQQISITYTHGSG